MTTSQMVKNLKENNQDFKWYPTTEEAARETGYNVNFIKQIYNSNFRIANSRVKALLTA
jgi:hypothetical protein